MTWEQNSGKGTLSPPPHLARGSLPSASLPSAGRGVTFSLSGPVLHLPRGAPVSSLRRWPKRNFRRVPTTPTPYLPPRPHLLPPERGGGEGGEGLKRGRGEGRLAQRPLGLALLPGGGGRGEARGAPASGQPPGPRLSAVARCLLSGRWRGPPAFGIPPERGGGGGWRRRRGGPAAGGEKRNPGSRAAPGAERSGGGSGGSALRPPAVHQRGRATSPGCSTRGIMHWLTGSGLPSDLFEAFSPSLSLLILSLVACVGGRTLFPLAKLSLPTHISSTSPWCLPK